MNDPLSGLLGTTLGFCPHRMADHLCDCSRQGPRPAILLGAEAVSEDQLRAMMDAQARGMMNAHRVTIDGCDFIEFKKPPQPSFWRVFKDWLRSLLPWWMV